MRLAYRARAFLFEQLREQYFEFARADFSQPFQAQLRASAPASAAGCALASAAVASADAADSSVWAEDVEGAVARLSCVALGILGATDTARALGAAASSLGNIGPAIGSVSPVHNFAHLSIGAKWFCSFLMLIGRLELFTVLILFTPFFWRKN